MESFNLEQFRRIVDYDVEFVQDNHSKSSKGVLRGLHYQVKYPQGKLVRCIFGSVYDVIVDIRKSSETFGKWIGVTLNRPDKQLWVPPCFAHGFYTLSDIAEITYKTTDYYHPEYERTILWNDVDLNIDWKISNSLPLLSVKDLEGDTFDICEKF
jgi:dTDP-4-dehydrorhamnose 3,5-epimerase